MPYHFIAIAGGTFDYVINLAAETAHGKPDEFYQKTVTGAQITAALSSMIGVKKYVFVSSANVYKPSSKPSNESATIGPWSQQASSLLAAEQALAVSQRICDGNLTSSHDKCLYRVSPASRM